MQFWFLKSLEALMLATFDVSASNLGVKLLMGGNDCESKRATAALLSDLTLDEYDGTGYTEYAAGIPTIFLDASGLHIEVQAPAGTFGLEVEAATNPAVGYVVYDTVSGKLLGYSTEGFPLNGDGGVFSITPDLAAGLLSLA